MWTAGDEECSHKEGVSGGGGLVPALLFLSQQLKHPLLVIDFVLQRQQGVPVILDACLQVRDKVIQSRLFGREGVVCIHHIAIVQSQFYRWKHPEVMRWFDDILGNDCTFLNGIFGC